MMQIMKTGYNTLVMRSIACPAWAHAPARERSTLLFAESPRAPRRKRERRLFERMFKKADFPGARTQRILNNLAKGLYLLFLAGLVAVPSSVQAAAVPDAPTGDTVAVASTDTTGVLTAELPAVSSLADISRDTLWSRANAAYSNGNYRQAVDLYDALLAQGVHSGKLYYNLGNSWFKQGRMGKAILNYNRALLLDPTDEDTQYNLAMANARIVDKIDTVPEFFLKSWLRDLGLLLGSDTWAVLGLVFLGIAFAAIILWLLSNTLALRKLGFYGGIVSLVFCLTATFYAHFQRTRLLHGAEAVVMNLVAPVKSSPGAGSKDIFVLHEGTKVRIQEQLDGWTEIVLADGNKGWIASNAIEAIVSNRRGGE